LTPEKPISRKIKEILTAMRIERNYSKEEILEMLEDGSHTHRITHQAKPPITQPY